MFNKSALIMFLVLLFSGITMAKVKLPAVISDNMVLQADSNVPIWGWADPNSKVKVLPSWSPKKYSTVSDITGKWMVKVKTPKAGQPGQLIIRCGTEMKHVKNILMGEVWLCGGQSNMRWYVKDSNNPKKEIAEANYPDIRLFVEPLIDANEPAEDCNGQWVICSPATVGKFSAAGYFFGRDIHKKLNVPIGLINAARGGTTAQAWISKDVLAADSELNKYLQKDALIESQKDKYQKIHEQNMARWQKNADAAKFTGKKIPKKPDRPRELLEIRRPSKFYNAMVHPLIPYTIKGVIWYQGEANVNDAPSYKKLFSTIINSWRNEWKQGDFPFYYAQLASHGKVINQPNDIVPIDSNLARLRESQFMTLSVPNTGMVVTMDIGEANSIHPRNKQDVGKRFSLLALAKDYGFKDIICSGPLYKLMKVEDDKIRVTFNYTVSGLKVKGDKLKGFTIAGEDKKFVWANAKIDGNTVVVWSENVKKPVAVRYGWADWMECNLYNKEDLPASPFRTDKW